MFLKELHLFVLRFLFHMFRFIKFAFDNIFVGPKTSLYVYPYEYVWQVLRNFAVTARQFPNFPPKKLKTQKSKSGCSLQKNIVLILFRYSPKKFFWFFNVSPFSAFLWLLGIWFCPYISHSLLKSVIKYLWHGLLHQVVCVTSSVLPSSFDINTLHHCAPTKRYKERNLKIFKRFLFSKISLDVSCAKDSISWNVIS